MINDKQKKVISASDYPAAVIAGPGTGKTFTIVKKVTDLVKNHGLAPNRILITTFTKKAAAELNVRILSEFKKEGIKTDLDDLKIGNFHSLANIFIEKYKKLDDDFFPSMVIDQDMEGYILEKNLGIFKEIDDFDKYIRYGEVYKIQEIFESVTNNLIDLDRLRTSKDPIDRLSYKIYMTHLNLLKSMKLMNFQMILKKFYDLLSDEVIGQEIRNSIDFVIIDEYQDTNLIQQEIAFKLLKDKNLMVFGDDDQSLYSFRGADPKNLLEFDQVCKDKLGKSASIYKLDINYRSNQAIIDTSQKWLNNYFGVNRSKQLKAIDQVKNPNSLVRARANNKENLLKIIRLLNENINLGQIAFLFPTLNSAYPKELEAFFKDAGIKVINWSSSKFFYRREIQILVYILASIYSSYPSNLTYNDYLSYEEKQKYFFRSYLAKLFDDQSFKSVEMDAFIGHFRNNHPNSISEIVYKAFSLPIFADILGKKLGQINSDRAMRNIGKFTKLVADYEDIFENSSGLEFIHGYLYYFFKKDSIKEFDDSTPDYDAINFMTIHNAKGLEFDTVFVSGLNDYPRENRKKLLEKYEYTKSDKDSADKDFYRKYYTAFTRAKNLLVILDNSRDQRLVDFANSLDNASKLSTIDFQKIDIEIPKPILSFTTDIEVYESCPLKYKFIRKLNYKLPKSKSLILGTNIHALAEYVGLHDVVDEEKLNEILATNNAYKKAIDNFRKQNFDLSLSEVNYKADRDFYILQGNIDLILADGSIMDLKTGSYDEETLEKYKKQLITYKYLCEFNDHFPNKLYLYFIEKDQIIEVGQEDFSIEKIDQIAKKIFEENIYKKTDKRVECKYCPMKYYCHRN